MRIGFGRFLLLRFRKPRTFICTTTVSSCCHCEGERADAVEIVKQIEFDEDLEVSWESLTNLEYELLVEDEYISRQVVDLWLDYFVVHKKSTAPQIVSRKCCRYMSKIIQNKYSNGEIRRIWKNS